jgi:hypothetical protein
MTLYELVVPTKLTELIDNYKPDQSTVSQVYTEALERAKGDFDLFAHGMTWANVKLTVQVELLKELLATEMSKNIPKVTRRGRPTAKAPGLQPVRFKKKRPTTGAPVQHSLGSSTKAHALEAYEQLYEVSGKSALVTAREYLKARSVDIHSEEGLHLVENLRKRINDAHLSMNGKRHRAWKGRFA